MDKELKKYELAYLIDPSVDDHDLQGFANNIAAALESVDIIVQNVETPKKIRLSYPIKHQTYGYFGWINFSTAPKNIKEAEKMIKNSLVPLLRYMLIAKDTEDSLKKRMPSIDGEKKQMPFTAPIAGQKSEESEAPKLDLEELDKKLNEILGK